MGLGPVTTSTPWAAVPAKNVADVVECILEPSAGRWPGDHNCIVYLMYLLAYVDSCNN